MKVEALAHSHAGYSHAGHSHDHGQLPEQITRSFVVGISLNTLMVVIGGAAGFYYHSLALLSDAGHNLSDVASLLIALAAVRLSKIKPNASFTYGYLRSSILTSLINGIILLVVTLIVLYEAIVRLIRGQIPVQGEIVSYVAVIGIIINLLSAWLFVKGKEADLNIKSTYLHLAFDALVSFSVVLAGIAIYFTHLYWIDSVISIVISIVILIASTKLLAQSLKLSLDGVPESLSVIEISGVLRAIEGIEGVHHLHLWALGTTKNALTAHLVIASETVSPQVEKIKAAARAALRQFNVEHATLEVETDSVYCKEHDCT